jgi:hypothetical protein
MPLEQTLGPIKCLRDASSGFALPNVDFLSSAACNFLVLASAGSFVSTTQGNGDRSQVLRRAAE